MKNNGRAYIELTAVKIYIKTIDRGLGNGCHNQPCKDDLI